MNIQNTCMTTEGQFYNFVEWVNQNYCNYQDRFRDLWKKELIPVVHLWSRGSRGLHHPEAVGLLYFSKNNSDLIMELVHRLTNIQAPPEVGRIWTKEPHRLSPKPSPDKLNYMNGCDQQSHYCFITIISVDRDCSIRVHWHNCYACQINLAGFWKPVKIPRTAPELGTFTISYWPS